MTTTLKVSALFIFSVLAAALLFGTAKSAEASNLEYSTDEILCSLGQICFFKNKNFDTMGSYTRISGNDRDASSGCHSFARTQTFRSYEGPISYNYIDNRISSVYNNSKYVIYVYDSKGCVGYKGVIYPLNLKNTESSFFYYKGKKISVRNLGFLHISSYWINK